MQTQITPHIHRYIDREALTRLQQQAEVWYYVFDHAIHQLICSARQKEVVGLIVYPAPNLATKTLSELQALIRTFDYAELDFQQTHLVFCNTRYTFVPEALFSSNAAASYLETLYPKRKWEQVYFERHSTMHLITVYGVNELFYNALRLCFPGVIVHHYAGYLTEYFAQESQHQREEALYGYFKEDGMELFHFKKGKLNYHNHFRFEGDTDIVYFILSVAESLNFLSDRWELFLAGEIAVDDSLTALMKKYIPAVHLLRRPDSLHYPASFREFQEHQHLLEVSGPLCAL